MPAIILGGNNRRPGLTWRVTGRESSRSMKAALCSWSPAAVSQRMLPVDVVGTSNNALNQDAGDLAADRAIPSAIPVGGQYNYTSALDGNSHQRSAPHGHGMNGAYHFQRDSGRWPGRPECLSGTTVNNFGTGSLVNSGNGTLVLTGANSYSGGTTVCGYTSGKEPRPACKCNINDNAALIFDQTLPTLNGGAAIASGTSWRQHQRHTAPSPKYNA